MNYKKVYDSIITHRRLNKLQKNNYEYYELHHIIPRCLGGTDEAHNLILLTSREHFICHCLLSKVYELKSHNWFKMNHTINAMKMEDNNKHGSGNRYINSRLYSYIKTRYWKIINEQHERDGIVKIHSICKFIDENDRLPISNNPNKKERLLGQKLSDFRKAKRYSEGYINLSKHINFYDSYIKTATELGYPSLFEIANYEKEGLDLLKEICDWIDENGSYPIRGNSELEDKYSEKIISIKKAKKGRRGLYFDSYQRYVESRGYDDIFMVTKERTIKKTIELCEWIKNNNKQPNKGGSSYETTLYIRLKNFRIRYSKGMLWQECVDIFEECNLEYHLLLSNDKYYIRIEELCKWIVDNGRIPKISIECEKELNYRLNKLRQKYKNNTIDEAVYSIIKKYDLLDLFITQNDLYLERIEELCMWVQKENRLPKYNSEDSIEQCNYVLFTNIKGKYNKKQLTDEEKNIIFKYDMEKYMLPQIEVYKNKIRAICEFMIKNKRVPSRVSSDKTEVKLNDSVSNVRRNYRNNKLKEEILDIIKEYKCEEYFGIK